MMKKCQMILKDNHLKERRNIMREVNNNSGIGHIGAQRSNQSFGNASSDLDRPSNVAFTNEKEIKENDLKNTPSGAIGLSQVTSSVDNIEKDVKVMVGNPEKVTEAVKLGDIAHAQAKKEGLDDMAATERAVKVAKAYVDEFAK